MDAEEHREAVDLYFGAEQFPWYSFPFWEQSQTRCPNCGAKIQTPFDECGDEGAVVHGCA